MNQVRAVDPGVAFCVLLGIKSDRGDLISFMFMLILLLTLNLMLMLMLSVRECLKKKSLVPGLCRSHGNPQQRRYYLG